MAIRSLKTSNRGHQIVIALWPDADFVSEGDFWDQYGIDALISGAPVQIKYDRRIAQSQNLYHEIYEKSALNPSQQWRQSSPGKVSAFIFCTETEYHIVAMYVTIDSLAEAERGCRLTVITPNNGCQTSMGFLIPVDSVKKEIRKALK